MTFKTICFAVLLLGSALVIDARYQAPDAEFECTEPPTGIWMVQHDIQVAPGVYVNRFESVLNLTKAFDNVFTGYMNLTDKIEGGYFGFLYYSGIFDQDTCIMAGSMVNHGDNVTDTFRHVYNGNEFVGEYLISVDGQLFFPRYSRHVGTYQG